jgi:signal transduction histidine kinase
LKVRAESLADRNDALRLAQLELEESHQQLSQALREIQLQNTELSDLNQEKNMILGMVSHDLKNPIGAVQGLSEMMVGEDFTEEQYKEFASVILETSNRMFALVKNFLDVARAEDGRMRMTLIQFDITNVIEMALESFRRQAFEKSITIHYDKPTSPATVYGDESLVMQVLDNLISNAIKYTPPGKDIAVNIAELQILRHNVTLFNDDMDTLDASAFVKCVRISITDEGPGLTDLDKTKLFGKFARLSAQPTGGESSTGLGLAITKRLVELMKGRVWCESEFGFGSRFTVELPSQPD